MIFIEDLFYTDALAYAVVFLLFFAVISFLLNRSGVFGRSRGISTLISVCTSLLIIWGLVNNTSILDSLFYSINDFTGDLSSLIYFLILAGIGVLFLAMFWWGFSKGARKLEIPWGFFAISGLLILIFFLPQIINIYYLPDWLIEYNWAFLVVGIVMFIIAITRFEQTKEEKEKKYWDTKIKGTKGKNYKIN